VAGVSPSSPELTVTLDPGIFLVSDIELSFNAMEAEYKATLQDLTDRRIARGAQRAATDDIDVINAIAAAEAQEQADRQYALALSLDENAQPPPVHSTPAQIGSSYRGSESSSSSSVVSQQWSPTDSLGSLGSSLASSQTSGRR
jgi:hypothetical protein